MENLWNKQQNGKGTGRSQGTNTSQNAAQGVNGPKGRKGKSKSKIPAWIVVIVLFTITSYLGVNGFPSFKGVGESISQQSESLAEKTADGLEEIATPEPSNGKNNAENKQLENAPYYTKIPGFGKPSVPKGSQIVRKSAFTLCYDEITEQAWWVAYTLSSADLKGTAKRDRYQFEEDLEVSTGSASPNDYKGSGYDRGHLAPAADMKRSEQAMKESFYMSNVSPQVPSFNQGIWNDLEQDFRKHAKKYGFLYMVTGPVLTDWKQRETIGRNQVVVPSAYYKLALRFTKTGEPKVLAYMMPNKRGEKAIKEYAVSIDKVEAATGLDFFSQIPDDVEEKLEKPVNMGFE